MRSSEGSDGQAPRKGVADIEQLVLEFPATIEMKGSAMTDINNPTPDQTLSTVPGAFPRTTPGGACNRRA